MGKTAKAVRAGIEKHLNLKAYMEILGGCHCVTRDNPLVYWRQD